MTTTLKFYYNGIKGSDGKLQKCSYSIGGLLHNPAATIRIYACEYDRFSDEIRQQFTVQKDSDGQSDYFETDRISVLPDHPLYNNVLAAANKAKANEVLDQAQESAEEFQNAQMAYGYGALSSNDYYAAKLKNDAVQKLYDYYVALAHQEYLLQARKHDEAQQLAYGHIQEIGLKAWMDLLIRNRANQGSAK